MTTDTFASTILLSTNSTAEATATKTIPKIATRITASVGTKPIYTSN